MPCEHGQRGGQFDNGRLHDQYFTLIAGTNWMWEMVHLALNKTSVVSGGGKFDQMVEAISREQLDAAPSPRILNTHLMPRYLPKVGLYRGLTIKRE